MTLEAQQRIPDITLKDNSFVDGQILRGFDLNKVAAILKVGVNANYADLKVLLNTTNKWGKIEGSIEKQTDLIEKFETQHLELLTSELTNEDLLGIIK